MRQHTAAVMMIDAVTSLGPIVASLIVIAQGEYLLCINEGAVNANAAHW